MNYKLLKFLIFNLWGIALLGQTNEIYFQKNTNLFLQQAAEKEVAKSELVQVFVKGDVEQINAIVYELGGKIRYSIKGYQNVLITAANAIKLLDYPAIQKIEYYPSKGSILVDQSLVNTRVNLVRQGASPLNKNYSGKGVIMGIIDTGIDPTHPDFQDSLGNTRILALWDQTKAFDSTLTPLAFGYGQAWDSSAINNGTINHLDPLTYFGHGTNVSGIAGGNGNSVPDSIANYQSYAYESYFVVVAANFSSNNFTSLVADGVAYIFQIADSLGMPAVINASLGTYTGSHDGLDLPALYIDSLLNVSKGRSMVAAAGNSGTVDPYHLGYQVNSDTNFTWFLPNPNSGFGINAMFFELWADTAQFNQVNFAFGLTDSSSGFLLGKTLFDNISNRLNALVGDSIFDTSGTYLGLLQTYCEMQGSRYLMQAFIANPPSNRFCEFITTGQGRFDVWSASFFGYSNMVSFNQTNIPQTARFLNYKNPDNLQSIVSSWACSPNVITVANYQNRNAYFDMDSVLQTFTETPGERVASSSRGPSRLGVQKPNIAAPGGLVLCAGLSSDLNQIKAIPSLRSYVGLGGYHRRNGGTSMASPAVAGIVALMLEKCPNLSSQEIISRIENSAFSDSLTNSNLPDFEWGSGKVDGFAALLGLDFKPKVVYSSDSLLCAGESVQLTTLNNYQTYQWSTGSSNNTATITSKGFYGVTVTDSLGCSATLDSIRVDSVPNPLIELGKDTVICWNETLTFSVDSNLNNPVWNGNLNSYSYTTNVDTLVSLLASNSFGCQSTDTIKISYFQKQKPNLGIDTSICFGDSLQFQFNSNFVLWSDGDSSAVKNIFSQGMHWVEVVDSNNCFAKDTFEITSLIPLPVISLLNDTAICSGDTLSINLSAQYQVKWEDNSSNNSRKFYSIGNYVAEAKDLNGCTTVDSFAITQVFGLPIVNLPIDTSICINDSLTISLPNSYSYLWSDGFAQNQRVIKNPIQLSVIVTDSNTCNYSDTFQLIQNFQLPSFSLGADTFICSGDSLEIGISNSNLTYGWNNGKSSQKIWVKTAGVYQLNVQDSNMCVFSDSIKVTENQLPAFSLGNDTSLCETGYTTVFLMGPKNMATYFWNVGQAGSIISVCNGPPGAICDYSIPSDSLIYLTVTDSFGCVFSDSIHFGVLPNPNVDLGKDTSICGNEEVLIFKNMQSSHLNYFYWYDGSTASTHQFEDFGKFWLEAIDTNGCSNADTILIDSLPVPIFSLGKDTLLPPSITNFEIGAGISAYEYLWHNGKTDSSIVLNIGSNYPQIIWCKVANQEGCFYSDSLQIDWYLWSVNETENTNSIHIYPNPASNYIAIKSGDVLTNSTIKIFDSAGRIVYFNDAVKSITEIEKIPLNLQSGAYLVRINSQQKVYSQWFTVY